MKYIVILLLFSCSEKVIEFTEPLSEECQRIEDDQYSQPRDVYRCIYIIDGDLNDIGSYTYWGCMSVYDIERLNDLERCEMIDVIDGSFDFYDEERTINGFTLSCDC